MTSLFDEVAEPAADGVQVRRVTITVNGRKRTADALRLHRRSSAARFDKTR
jgi:hypothetical protein